MAVDKEVGSLPELPSADAQERSPISVASLLAVASTFTDLRTGIMDVLTNHLTVDEGWRILGQEAAAEALIFFFAEKLNPPSPLEASVSTPSQMGGN